MRFIDQEEPAPQVKISQKVSFCYTKFWLLKWSSAIQGSIKPYVVQCTLMLLELLQIENVSLEILCFSSLGFRIGKWAFLQNESTLEPVLA